MTMIEAYKTCIRKYVTFDGRARRREYWLFYLCNLLVSVMFFVLITIAGMSSQAYNLIMVLSGFMGLYFLFLLLPGLALTFRRLHDTGRSGAWVFIALVPAIGAIILLIYLCEQGNVGSNQFGPDPKAGPVYTPPKPVDRQVNIPVGTPTQVGVRNVTPVYSQRSPTRMNVSCVGGQYAGMMTTGDVVYIGRDSNLCQLVFPQNAKGVSRVHCMLHANGSSIELTDMNSTYGTYLSNGSRVPANSKVILRSGDTFSVGDRNNRISVSLT